MLKKLKELLGKPAANKPAVYNPDAEDWDAADARNLAAFLGTETGRRLLGELQRNYDVFALNAIHKGAEGDPRYACGVASGIQAVLRNLQQFSATPGPQDGKPDDARGAEALVERMAP
jgi:hypothetical protein